MVGGERVEETVVEECVQGNRGKPIVESQEQKKQMWEQALDAIQRERYAEYGSSPLASALASWSLSTTTIIPYPATCHMQALAELGESVEA